MTTLNTGFTINITILRHRSREQWTQNNMAKYEKTKRQKEKK